VKRHLMCVSLLIWAVACSGVDRRSFQGVERASQAIQTAIDGKATLPQYRQLYATFSSELSTVKAHASNARERAVVAEYEAAMKALTDLQLVWEDKDARGSDMLPIREELPARIAREYNLGVNTNEPPSIYAGEALQAIWQRARGHLANATKLLAG
jgi:hypothetical protein